MSCAIGMIRWLIFLVNFIFALGGLALLGCSIYLQFNLSDVSDLPDMQVIHYPTILLIVIGAGVFIIAFFGCCGAVQENHCMIVMFALSLLTLLFVQVAVASYGYYRLKEQDLEQKINIKLKELVNKYETSSATTKTTVNALQTFGECCGYDSYKDYGSTQIPYSCCNNPEDRNCSEGQVRDVPGCKNQVYQKLESYGHRLGLGALIIAAVELVGVVFAFCLANSIRNAERRGYKV